MSSKPPIKKKSTHSKDLGADEQGKRERRWLDRAAQQSQAPETSDGFDRDEEEKPPNSVTDSVETGNKQTRRSLAITGRSGGVGGLGLEQPAPQTKPSSLDKVSKVGPNMPNAGMINDTARNRVKSMGRHYSVRAGWRSPNPEIMGNPHPDLASIPGSQDQHKDLYLCLDVLFVAGFSVPTIAVDMGDQPGGRWYPDALDLLQSTRGSERLLHLVASEKLRGKNQKQRHLRIGKVLTPGRSGDLVMAEYLAEDGSVYGLTWLLVDAVENPEAPPNSWTLAFANEQGARIIEVGVPHFSYAESLTVLRPVRAKGSVIRENRLKTVKVFS